MLNDHWGALLYLMMAQEFNTSSRPGGVKFLGHPTYINQCSINFTGHKDSLNAQASIYIAKGYIAINTIYVLMSA